MQAQQFTNEAAKASHMAGERRRTLSTVRQFSERNPAFSEAAVRNLVFKADSRHSTKGEIPGNGLIEAGAIVRIGRKVLIDEEAFFAWIDGQKSCAARGAK